MTTKLKTVYREVNALDDRLQVVGSLSDLDDLNPADEDCSISIVIVHGGFMSSIGYHRF